METIRKSSINGGLFSKPCLLAGGLEGNAHRFGRAWASTSASVQWQDNRGTILCKMLAVQLPQLWTYLS
jgi:hypothetical protein